MATRLADDTLSASWLASRFAIEPFKLEAMRRDGEVIAFRPAGAREHYYPLWQFDDEGHPLPVVRRLVVEARGRGLSAATGCTRSCRRVRASAATDGSPTRCGMDVPTTCSTRSAPPVPSGVCI